MATMKKRALAWVLSLAMVLTFLPVNALAEEQLAHKDECWQDVYSCECTDLDSDGVVDHAEGCVPAKELCCVEGDCPVYVAEQERLAKLAEDQAAADAVVALIAAVQTAEDAQAAREAYGLLTEEQKALVGNLADLEAAVAWMENEAQTFAGETYTVEVDGTITIQSEFVEYNDHAWVSDNPAVAEVTADEFGYNASVTGMSEGTATITHTYGRVYKETFTVNVAAAEDVEPLAEGDLEYTADKHSLTTGNSTNKKSVAAVIWKSTENGEEWYYLAIAVASQKLDDGVKAGIEKLYQNGVDYSTGLLTVTSGENEEVLYSGLPESASINPSDHTDTWVVARMTVQELHYREEGGEGVITFGPVPGGFEIGNIIIQDDSFIDEIEDDLNYSLTYHPNGGVGGPVVRTYIGPEKNHTFTVESNGTIGFTRPGYEFKGWATTATATTPDVPVGSVITLSSPNDMDRTIYAVWEEITPSVSIDAYLVVNDWLGRTTKNDYTADFPYAWKYPGTEVSYIEAVQTGTFDITLSHATPATPDSLIADAERENLFQDKSIHSIWIKTNTAGTGYVQIDEIVWDEGNGDWTLKYGNATVGSGAFDKIVYVLDPVVPTYTVTAEGDNGVQTTDVSVSPVNYDGTSTVSWTLKDGYELVSVTVNGNVETVTGNSLTLTGIRENKEVVITTQAKDATYVVEYYYENAAGGFDLYRTSDSIDTKFFETVTATNSDKTPEKDGYVFADGNSNNVLSATVESESGTVLKIYFEYSTLNYTVVAHYIDAAGNEVHEETLVSAGTGDYGTAISGLLPDDYTDPRSYNSENYLYDRVEVNGAPFATQTLTVDNTEIDIYYDIDAKGTPDGGDGTADKYQVFVEFKERANGSVSNDADFTPYSNGEYQTYTFTVEGPYSVTPTLEKVLVTPATGYKFDKWTKDNGTEAVDPETALTNIAGGATIIFWANFTTKQYTVEGYFASNSSGAITGTTPQTVDHGTDASELTFTATEGYEIISVTVNGTEQLATNQKVDTYSYTATNVTENVTIIATTAPKQYSYTVEYYYDGALGEKPTDTAPTGGSAAFGSKVDLTSTIQALTPVTYNNLNYVLYPVETEYAVTIGTGSNVIRVDYLKDVIGPKDEPDTNPDKFQVTVLYQSADTTKGTVGETVKEVITIRDKDGEYAESDTVQISGSTAKPSGDNYFEKWTATAENHAGWTDTNLNVDEAKITEGHAITVKGGATYTYTATFDAQRTLAFEVEDKSVTYSGAEQSGYTNYTMTGTLAEGHTVTVTYDPQEGTNVGDYGEGTFDSIIIKDATGKDVTGQYKITSDPGKLVITRKAVTVVITPTDREYDGTVDVDVTTGNLAGVIDGDEVSLANEPTTGTMTNANVGNDKAVEVTEPTLSGEDAGNYTLTVTVEPVDISAKKITVTIEGNTATKPYTGGEQFVEGYEKTCADSAYDLSKVAFSGTEAKAKGTDARAEAYPMGLTEGQFSNTDGNYEVKFEVTDGWLKITPKAVTVTIEGHTATKPYTGSEQFVEGYEKTCADSAYDLSKVAFSGTEAKAKGTDARAEAYPMGLTEGQFSNTDGNYEVKFEVTDGWLKITPKAVTVTIEGHTATKPYTGSEQFVEGYEKTCADSAYDLSKVAFSGTEAKAKGTDARAEAYPMGLTEGQFSNTDGNYEVKFEVTDGWLKITPKAVTVTIEGHTATKPYTGSEQFVEGYEKTCADSAYDLSKVAFSGTEAKAKGTDARAEAYPMGLTEGQFSNTDGNYEVKFEVTDGWLKITPKAVTVTIEGHTATKPYTGSEQFVEGYEKTSSDSAYDLSKVAFSGTEAKAKGTDARAEAYPMGLTEGQFSNTDGNYEVKFEVTDGWLKITPKAVTVTIEGHTATKPYTGSEQFVEGYEKTSSDSAYDLSKVAFSGTEAKAKGTDARAEAYPMGLTEGQFSNTDGNYEVKFEVTDGWLKITPKAVTVTIEGHTATKPYTGSEQFVEGYEKTSSDSAYDLSKVAFSGTEAKAKGTDARAEAYPMGLTEGQFSNTDGNYEVKFEVTDGWLKITPKEVTVTADNKTKVFGENDPDLTATVSEEGVTLLYKLTREPGENVGEYTINVTGDEIQGNYKVTYKTGTLIITTADEVVVMIKGNSDSKVYNGKEQSVTGYTVTSISNKKYTENDFTFTGGAVAKGTDVGPYKMNLAESQFANNNTNFKEVKFVITDGTLTITPIATPIIITADSASKQYDGTPLTDDGYSYTANVLVEGDKLTAVVEGSQTEVGSSPNKVTSYKVMRGEVDVTANYTFGTPVDGTLTVTKQPTSNISVVKDRTSPATVKVGDKIEWNIVISNDGDAAAKGVKIDDNLPGVVLEQTVVDVPANGSVTVKAYYVVQPDDAGKTLYNTVTVTDPGKDPTDPTDDKKDTDTDEGTEIVKQYTVYTQIDKHGTITPDKTYDAGDDATVVFTIDKDYEIESVTVDGERYTDYEKGSAKNSWVITFEDLAADHEVIVTTDWDGYVPPRPDPKPDPEEEIDIPEEEVPLAGILNVVDHFAYIVGYDDGLVKPDNNITRAEVATIFFRLMTDEFRTINWSTENEFPDVLEKNWFNNAISTSAMAGIVKGYPDGTFKPNNKITRAEFAAIAARFLSDEYEGVDLFTDIDGHWANELINRAASAGWINGYPDGTFRPDAYITRAEAMQLINNMLGRIPHLAHLLDDMRIWADNRDIKKWYYLAVQEATNSHDYDFVDHDDAKEDDQGHHEVWTELLPDRDWAALEHAWSESNDAPGGEVMD